MQLKDDNFDVLFVSPLRRAQQTADIVAASRDLPATMLPALREIDLYSFQVCGAAPRFDPTPYMGLGFSPLSLDLVWFGGFDFPP